jgi:hypothetical protein
MSKVERCGEEAKPEIKQDVFWLPEGYAELKWPEEMSQESLRDFQEWLQLVLRKAERIATATRTLTCTNTTEAGAK